MSNTMKTSFIQKAAKDPLFHFLILGGLVFALVTFWGPKLGAQNHIVITQAAQQHLADLFEVTWQRKPSPNELKNLIQDHIKEEIYYREALDLGLDKNDTIIRRRLRQKLEFMQEDITSLKPASEVNLRTYYEAHIDKYKSDQILSFDQVLVSPQHLKNTDENIVQALAQLKSGALPKDLSRSSLLPVFLKHETAKTIKNIFGSDFTSAVLKLKLGQWQGPVYSSFGTHLVNVYINQAPKPLSFEQSHQRVAADYMRHQREKAATNDYKNLRSHYRITVEPPQ